MAGTKIAARSIENAARDFCCSNTRRIGREKRWYDPLAPLSTKTSGRPWKSATAEWVIAQRQTGGGRGLCGLPRIMLVEAKKATALDVQRRRLGLRPTRSSEPGKSGRARKPWRGTAHYVGESPNYERTVKRFGRRVDRDRASVAGITGASQTKCPMTIATRSRSRLALFRECSRSALALKRKPIRLLSPRATFG